MFAILMRRAVAAMAGIYLISSAPSSAAPHIPLPSALRQSDTPDSLIRTFQYRVTPYTKDGKTINIFVGPPTSAGGYGLASGLGRELWYGLKDNGNSYIATITTSGTATLKRVADLPYGIVEGAFGNQMWFTEVTGRNGYASITAGFYTTQFKLLGNSLPGQIAVGADKRLYFGVPSQIVVVAGDGSATYRPTPNAYDVEAGIVLGPDGNVWYAQNSPHSPQTLGYVTPAGKMKPFPLVGNASGIAVGSDQKIWFGSATKSAVYSVSTSGTALTRFTTGITGVPQQMVEGPDGNIYFSEYASSTGQGAVAQITVGGNVTEYALPQAFVPYAITVGPDGNIWVLDETHDQLGQLVLP